MSIRSFRTRLERLQARAGGRYVVGQDRNRDRKRREELRHLKLSPGLTKAQIVELAELDAAFAQEDRDYGRKWELFYNDRFGPGLTDAERIEYAELQKRYPPNPNPPFGDLATKLRAVTGDTAADGARNKFESAGERAPTDVGEGLTLEANRGAAISRPAPTSAEKLKPASPDSTAPNGKSELDLAHLVARIGAIYTKQGLSPPFALRDAAKHWLGLSEDEIVDIIEKHFDVCRRFYTRGAGDQHFNIVRAAIGKALEAGYSRDRFSDPEWPRRPRRRGS